MNRPPQLLRVGDAALSVELGDRIDLGISARVRGLDRALQAAPFPGLREAVPSYRALLVHFDPGVVSLAAVQQHLQALLDSEAAPELPGELHLVPTVYGGEDGPDLESVAHSCGITPEELIAVHAGQEYRVFMLGFLPGFAYLGVLPQRVETARRATPRVRVKAGSVGIAGRATAIYPAASPGGWNLIGRTSLRLFDPSADPPALLAPGDRVRYQPVDALPQAAEARPARASDGPVAVQVESGGLLTTVQDAGRCGFRRMGVPAAGALDLPALHRANALVGNLPGAAALEATVVGPTLRFQRSLHFAIAGADLGAVLERSDLGPWPVPLGVRVLARAGSRLVFSGRRTGCRAYLGFEGGIEVPEVLGSRSTDLVSGFGGLRGRPLDAGDALAVGVGGMVVPKSVAEPAPGSRVSVRVVLGPQDDQFPPESVARFLDQPWQVLATSDRVGCRLSGERLTHTGSGEIVSDAMLPGCIQVPPDGQPIVMLADAPTTGGYPKIATVVEADLPLLAQLLPGEGTVRFSAAW